MGGNPSGNFVPTPGYEKIRRDAFSSLEVTRPPSFRKKVEPKYPSEAKRAGKEGKVVLMATIDAWMAKPKKLRSRRTRLDLAAPEPSYRL